MKIALFADIHGKILLPFKLVDLYQKETGEKIDYILQCGDIGCFPDIKKLDKATIRHAKKDRDELGFYDDFTKEIPQIKSFLNKLDINMICVRGNHEDHDYLDELEEKCETLFFIGVGRIGDRKNRTNKTFIQEYEKRILKKLLKTKDSFDVLLSHDKASESQRGYGMKELRQLLDNVIFSYHFYGHTGEDYSQKLDDNTLSQSVKIKECEWSESGILDYGSMLILEKENSQITLKVVEQKITNKLNKFTWKQEV